MPDKRCVVKTYFLVFDFHNLEVRLRVLRSEFFEVLDGLAIDRCVIQIHELLFLHGGDLLLHHVFGDHHPPHCARRVGRRGDASRRPSPGMRAGLGCSLRRTCVPRGALTPILVWLPLIPSRVTATSWPMRSVSPILLVSTNICCSPKSINDDEPSTHQGSWAVDDEGSPAPRTVAP